MSIDSRNNKPESKTEQKAIKLPADFISALDSVIFKETEENETFGKFILQENRPKEGNPIVCNGIVKHYEYTGNQILYVSDLHLEHMIMNYRCKSAEDIVEMIQRLCNRLEESYQMYTSIFRSNTYVIINGDIASERKLFELFLDIASQHSFSKGMILILGNHELWGYNKYAVEEIVKDYKAIAKKFNVRILHNEILFAEDNYDDYGRFNDSLSSSSCCISQKNWLIRCKDFLNASTEDISEALSSARMVILGGIGFSGCNSKFNANNGIYRGAVSRKQEIKESQKFNKIYTKLLEILPEIKDRVIVVATHMPLADWHGSEDYQDGIIYLSGHTHRNLYDDDGSKRIFADNQNGYHGLSPEFKCIYTEDTFDPFLHYDDGVYPITKVDYIKFYRAKRIKMTLTKDPGQIYMLKKNGYYCFLVEKENRGLFILNGGATKKTHSNNVNYYFSNMDKIINAISNPLREYTLIQKQVSDAIKAFGGDGTIHGCIVDIDDYNHVYVNPFDLKLTGYFAVDIIKKYVYPSVPELLNSRCPELYENYIRMIGENPDSAIILKKSEPSPLSAQGEYYPSTDIYKASREIRKMQKLSNNILCTWNDELIRESERKELTKKPTLTDK